MLRTVPLLAACLPKGKCKVLIGRRFTEERYVSSELSLSYSLSLYRSVNAKFSHLLRHAELAAVCRDAHTLVLYPGSDAENLEDMDIDFTATPHSVIIIDGTWSQAKDMFLRNALLHLPKQVNLIVTLLLLELETPSINL